nr:hypothetical protein [Chloroflexota bacterium]
MLEFLLYDLRELLEPTGRLDILVEYRASLVIMERLTAEDPSNALWQRELAVSHSKVGGTLQVQGDLVGALTEYRASLTILGRLATADPSNDLWQEDLAVSHQDIGRVLQTQGDLAGALTEYRASLTITERLAAADPSNAEWQRDLWVACCWIADVLEHSGDPAALEWWRRAYEILSGMKRAGIYISPADEEYYQQLHQKLEQ